MVFIAQCVDEHVLEGVFAQKNGWRTIFLSPAKLVIVIHKPQNGVGGV
jgi:hypothetical protein